MKAIMIGIRPELVAKILNEEKTIEIRRTIPKCDLPVEVYIYCNKQGRPLVYGSPCSSYVADSYVQTCGWGFGEANKVFGALNGKVVAKFTLNKVEKIRPSTRWDFDFENEYEWSYEFYAPEILRKSCLTDIELDNYVYSKTGKCYAWHIDNLQIFDKPKELKDFGLNRAPQSGSYVEVRE